MPVFEVEYGGKTYEVDAPDAAAAAKFSRELTKAKNPGEYDPDSTEFQAKYGPTGTTGENLRAGAGKAFVDLARGASQVAGGMSEEEFDEVKRRDAPLMRTRAARIGNLGGNIAASLPAAFVPGANSYTGSALIGAGLGALQPVGTGDSRGANAAFGAGGSLAGRFVANRASSFLAPRVPASSSSASNARATATPGQAGAQSTLTATPEMSMRGGGYTFGSVGDDASAGLTATQREILSRGQSLGMRSTPGQSTGSRALQQFEAKLESQPMTSGPFNTIKANNASVLNRAAASAIGESADVVDSAVLDRAFMRIGNVFESAADDVARPIDPKGFITKFSQVQDDLDGLVTGFGDHPLVAQLTKLAQRGDATGKQLQSLTSKLGKAAYKQMTTASGDRDLGMGLYSMKDYVDDLLQSGMEPAKAAAFSEARGQYRNLMMLTSRVGVVNPSTGNVSGRSLANVLQQKDKAGFLRGRNRTPMYDAARFSQAFAPIVGDSGTATRMPLQGFTDMVTRIPMNLATRAYASSPSVNLAVGAQAAANAVQPVASRALGPAAPYINRYLPGYAGLLAPQLLAE